MLKRLVCSGNPEKCFTHKMGYCISNENSGQDPYFEKENSAETTEGELKEAYVRLPASHLCWTIEVVGVLAGFVEGQPE